LVVCGAALSTLLLLRALEKPTWVRWLGYTLALVGTGYLNLVALSIITGHAIGVLAYTREGRWKMLGRFAAAALPAAATVIPIALSGHRQQAAQIAVIGAPPVPTLADLYHALPQIVSSTAVAVALAVALILVWRNPERRGVAFAVAYAVVPILVVWVVSHHGTSYFYFLRYFAFTAPAWAMVAGATARWLPGAKGAIAVVAAFAVVAVPAQRQVHSTYSHFWFNYPATSIVPPSGYQSAARYVAAHYQFGDEATFPGRMDYFDGINYYLPARMRLHDILVERTAAEADQMLPVFCTDPESCAANGPQRVWLFVPGSTDSPLLTVPTAQFLALTAHYRVTTIDHVTGITIALMVRTG
jgi:mannosyltransferase